MDPAATFVHEAKAGDTKLEVMAGGAGSSIGKGGMITKILAAKRAAGSGASTVIAWGREPDALLRLAQGEAIGTLLVAPTHKQQARKQWMADHLQLRGSVTIDVGAVLKLRDEGKSLVAYWYDRRWRGSSHVVMSLPFCDRATAKSLCPRLGQLCVSAEARLLCRKASERD